MCFFHTRKQTKTRFNSTCCRNETNKLENVEQQQGKSSRDQIFISGHSFSLVFFLQWSIWLQISHTIKSYVNHCGKGQSENVWKMQEKQIFSFHFSAMFSYVLPLTLFTSKSFRKSDGDNVDVGRNFSDK